MIFTRAMYILIVCIYWLHQNPEKIMQIYDESTGENVLHFLAK
jgi:hypothetical protein